METFADGATTRTLGQVLAEERARQSMSAADVAQRLHMSPWQVEALEAGDYSRLPKGTFLRGFVRNYARLLHADSEPLLALLPESSPAHKAAGNIVPPSEKIRFEPMGQKAGPMSRAITIAFVVLAFALAVVYWWLFMKDTPPAAEARKPAGPVSTAPAGAPQQVAAAPVPPAETPPPVEAPREEAPRAGSSAAAPDPVQPASPPPAPARAEPSAAASGKNGSARPESSSRATPGERRLSFRFTGDSWVEIRDANGRTLMSKLHSAGSEAQVSGRAPFTVIVGNAPAVQLTSDDRPIDLQPHSRVGVARLTIQ